MADKQLKVKMREKIKIQDVGVRKHMANCTLDNKDGRTRKHAFIKCITHMGVE